MKIIIKVIGILLIASGVAALGYSGFTYTKREKVAQIGIYQVTTDIPKKEIFSPIWGGALLLGGLVFVLAGRRKK